MELKLPLSLIGRGDLARLLRELNRVDDKLVGPGQDSALPLLSQTLVQLAQLNNYNLPDAGHRQLLKTALQEINNKAPNLHISFAAEPTTNALNQILAWLRQNIHPQVLLQVGLQPSIAAGCVLRTPNHVFDMSLKESLQKQEPYLVRLIKGATSER